MSPKFKQKGCMNKRVIPTMPPLCSKTHIKGTLKKEITNIFLIKHTKSTLRRTLEYLLTNIVQRKTLIIATETNKYITLGEPKFIPNIFPPREVLAFFSTPKN